MTNLVLGLCAVVFFSLGMMFLFNFRKIASKSHQFEADFWASVPYIGSGVLFPFRFYRYFQALLLIVPSFILFIVLAVRIL